MDLSSVAASIEGITEERVSSEFDIAHAASKEKVFESNCGPRVPGSRKSYAGGRESLNWQREIPVLIPASEGNALSS
jgi:hypothetical protein